MKQKRPALQTQKKAKTYETFGDDLLQDSKTNKGGDPTPTPREEAESHSDTEIHTSGNQRTKKGKEAKKKLEKEKENKARERRKEEKQKAAAKEKEKDKKKKEPPTKKRSDTAFVISEPDRSTFRKVCCIRVSQLQRHHSPFLSPSPLTPNTLLSVNFNQMTSYQDMLGNVDFVKSL